MIDNQDKKTKEITQIKIFNTSHSDSITETQINNWLRENSHVIVKDIKITASHSSSTYCIIYQKPEEI